MNDRQDDINLDIIARVAILEKANGKYWDKLLEVLEGVRKALFAIAIILLCNLESDKLKNLKDLVLQLLT